MVAAASAYGLVTVLIAIDSILLAFGVWVERTTWRVRQDKISGKIN
jgi:hypothetical protein